MRPQKFENIPGEMQPYAQWVIWRYEIRDGKPTKIPYCARSGRPASVTNPSTWGTFAEACAAYAVGDGDGIGFVLTKGDPFAFVDLDYTEGDEAALEQQMSIFNASQGYAELSPSGKGLHLIVKGDLPSGRRRGKIEVYSSERYMTMTGNVYRPGAVEPQQDFLQSVWASLGGSAPQPLQDVPDAPQTASDEDVHHGASTASNGDKFRDLWAGQWQRAYASQSEADQALVNIIAFYTKNKAQIARMFRSSALGQRDKANRDDYVSGLITKGLDRELAPVAHNLSRLDPRNKSAKSNLIMRPMSEVLMTSIEYLWKGWYPYGYITLVVGETGAAKSTAVAYTVAKVSNGQAFPGETEGRPPAKVLWLGSEDGNSDMTVPRLIANGANLANIIEIQGVSRDGVRGTFSMQDDILNIVELLKDGIARNEPYKVIVIDPITSYLSGTKQREVKINDAGQLRGVLEPWLVVAQQYKIAIVCITHFMKDTTRSMLHRVLGSAAFGETCRSLIAFVDRSSDEQPFGKSMIQVKTNLPEHPGGAWLFETEKVQVGEDRENGKAIFATRPKWDRLDALVSMDNSVAKSGAYSDTAVGFAVWISSYFKSVPEYQGVLVAEIKAAAIAQHVVTEKNWEKHSPIYLEKKNVGGIWECRPRTRGE